VAYFQALSLECLRKFKKNLSGYRGSECRFGRWLPEYEAAMGPPAPHRDTIRRAGPRAGHCDVIITVGSVTEVAVIKQYRLHNIKTVLRSDSSTKCLPNYLKIKHRQTRLKFQTQLLLHEIWYLEYLGVGGRITLKWTLGIDGTNWIWLAQDRSSGGLL
jgi:hypothetical protein